MQPRRGADRRDDVPTTTTTATSLRPAADADDDANNNCGASISHTPLYELCFDGVLTGLLV